MKFSRFIRYLSFLCFISFNAASQTLHKLPFNIELSEETTQLSALKLFLATQDIKPGIKPLKIALTTVDFWNDGYLAFLANLRDTVKSTLPEAEILLIIQTFRIYSSHEDKCQKYWIEGDSPCPEVEYNLQQPEQLVEYNLQQPEQLVARLKQFDLTTQPLYLIYEDNINSTAQLFSLDTINASINKAGVPDADLTLSIAHHGETSSIMKNLPNPLHIGWIGRTSDNSDICTSDNFSAYCIAYLQGLGRNSLGILRSSLITDYLKNTEQDRKKLQTTALEEIAEKHPNFAEQLFQHHPGNFSVIDLEKLPPFFYTYSHSQNAEHLLEYITFIAAITPDDWTYLPFIIQRKAFSHLLKYKDNVQSVLAKQGLTASFNNDDTLIIPNSGKHIAFIEKPFLQKHQLTALQDLAEPVWGVSSHNSIIEAVSFNKIPFFLANEWDTHNETKFFNKILQDQIKSKISFSGFFQNSFSIYDSFYKLDYDEISGAPFFAYNYVFQARKSALGSYGDIAQKAQELSHHIPSTTLLVEAVLTASKWFKGGGQVECPTPSASELCQIRDLHQELGKKRRKKPTEELRKQIQEMSDPIIKGMLERML